MDYEKKYKDALERAQKELQTCGSIDCDAAKQIFRFFPELKESEDEKIRKRILLSLEKDLIATKNSGCNTKDLEECIAWLEKQKVTDEEIIFRPVVGTDIRIAAKQALEKIGVGKKVVLAFNGAYIPVNGKTVGEIDSEYDAWLKKQSDTNKTINRNEFAQGVLRGAAINLITWIDYNTAKGNMCLSNMECKVIEDALVNGDWDKIYAYIKRKLEKQGEQNPVDFKAKDWYVSKVDGKIHNMTYNPTDKVEPNPTWSDENKKIIDGIIEYLECFNDYDCGDEPYEEYYERFEKYIKFMESLKPQPQWKPSEEQMKGIDCAIKTLRHQLNVEDKRLNSLYEQLKKL